MKFMIFEKGKKSILKEDVVTVVKAGANAYCFYLRNGHVIQLNEATDEDCKIIKAIFFTDPRVGTF